MISSHYGYLLVDILCFIFPFMLSFTKWFKFIQYWRSFLIASTTVAIPFLIWDSIFTRLSVWWFSEKYTLSLRIFYLPLEEILFFYAIPYACLFSYYVIKKYVPIYFSYRALRIFYILVVFFLVVMAIFNYEKYYTFYTFIFLSFFLIFMILKNQYKILYYLLLMFIFILPMMIASDGVLTGGFIVESPIVNYNPLYHLGYRVFNIPIEDFFYGFLLLGLNVLVFEKVNDYFTTF